ncbi:MAG: molybdenum cofactor guanylyltransferase MobA [Hyphomicrobiaceae bacterium]
MSELPNETLVGVVLAGGLSRRMGGGDKALLALGGATMLDLVLARFSPQVTQTVINANGDASRFARYGLAVVGDTVDGFVGPLAGVLAGMRWAGANAPAASHILTVSSDAPFVPHDLRQRLVAGLAAGQGRIALAASGGHRHPVIGLWPVALADDLEEALHDGLRKVLAWTDRHGTVLVDFPFVNIGGEAVDPFFNANTPEEMDEARRLLARLTP